jgi:hypothetical protein
MIFDNSYIKASPEAFKKLIKIGYKANKSDIESKPYNHYVLRDGKLLGVDGKIGFDPHRDKKITINDIK